MVGDAAMIATRLTDKFGLSVPVISAPMAHAAGGKLAASVSGAGALGMIGGGYCDRQWLEEQFFEAGNAAVGCGLITWKLAEVERDEPGFLDMILNRRPKALFLSFGDPAPFIKRARKMSISVMAQVQTVSDALHAVEAGAEVIVAQGTEAGGHGSRRGTMSFVPEVVDAVGDRAIVVAAGGIADGRGLAAALMLGADGVLMGTRFWASREALVPDGFHKDALDSDGDATLRSSLPDIARGYEWPEMYDIRTLKGPWTERWREMPEGLAAEARRAEYVRASREGDSNGAAAVAGEAVGLIGSIESVETIVENVMRQAMECLSGNWRAR